MPAFEYRYLDQRGRQKKGVAQADSPRQVRQQLLEKGFVPLDVEAAADTPANKRSWLDGLSTSGRLAPGELAAPDGLQR